MLSPLNRNLCQHQSEQMQRLWAEHPQARSAEPLFHACDLPPEVVLESGIPATGGDNYDLREHQRAWTYSSRSALRGACRTAEIPAAFAGTGSYVYKIYPVGGGIDVNAALGDKRFDAAQGRMVGSLAPEEQEVAFASYTPPCQIEGYLVVGQYSELYERYRLQPLVANPSFQPGAWKDSQAFVNNQTKM